MIDQISYNFWDKEIAWIAVVILSLLTSLIMFKRAYIKSDSGIHFNPIFRGYGLFALGYAISRILFVFSDVEKLNHGDTSTAVLFVLASYIVGIFSAISLISVYETQLLHMNRKLGTKTFLTFAFSLVGGFGLILIFPNIALTIIIPFRVICTILAGIGFLVIFLLYAKIIHDLTGDLRRNAIFTFIGFILIFVGR